MPRKNRSPAFQFYPADYLSDPNVACMSLEAQGAYIRLLCYCWQQGKLPQDEDELQKLAGVHNGHHDWSEIGPQVLRCFRSNGRGAYTHPRLLREKRKQDEFRKRSKRGGIASGKARRDKKLAKGGSVLVEPNANSSSSSSSSSTPVDTPLTPRRAGTRQSRFDEFWLLYPKKVGKKAAYREFEKAERDGMPPLEEVLAVLRSHVQVAKNGSGVKFMKDPERWLKHCRWEDEIETVVDEGVWSRE